MSKETKAKEAAYDGRTKVNEFRKMWLEKYPEDTDQTGYNLVMHLLDALQTAVHLAGEIEE